MLTLYYSPGACSLASHISLLEKNIPYKLQKVDLSTHMTEDGRDFYSLSQNKGYVPVLALDNGEILTEGVAILFYISEHGSDSSGKIGKDDFNRYRLQEALTFISSELHKTLGAYFNPKLPDAYKEISRVKISNVLNLLDAKLKESPFLVGDDFTEADAYCFTILRWLSFLDTGLSLADWPNVKAYSDKICQRPKVIDALKYEGV